MCPSCLKLSFPALCNIHYRLCPDRSILEQTVLNQHLTEAIHIFHLRHGLTEIQVIIPHIICFLPGSTVYTFKNNKGQFSLFSKKILLKTQRKAEMLPYSTV